MNYFEVKPMQKENINFFIYYHHCLCEGFALDQDQKTKTERKQTYWQFDRDIWHNEIPFDNNILNTVLKCLIYYALIYSLKRKKVNQITNTFILFLKKNNLYFFLLRIPLIIFGLK